MPQFNGKKAEGLLKYVGIGVVLAVVVAVIILVCFSLFGKTKEGFECWCRSDAGGPGGAQAVPQAGGATLGVSAPVGPAAVDNGAYNAGWGVTSAMFPDVNARVIWNVAGSVAGAPPNATKPIVFAKYYNNPNTTPTPVNMLILVDDTAAVTLNGTQVANITNCCTVTTVNMTLAPGPNVLSFSAMNLGTSNNPAGILASITDANNNVLFHTDNSWVIVSQ